MKVTKKLLSLWLALVMVVSMLPATVLATEAELYDGIETVETLSDEAVLSDESDVTDDAEAVEDAAEPAEQAEEQEIAAPVEEIALAQEMPALNAAGDEAVVVIACSDFQAPKGDADGQKTVTSILNNMKSDGITSADGFICCGDYYYNYNDNESTLRTHLGSLKSSVEDVYGTGLDEVFVQGNHDRVKTGTGGLSSSGANDTDDYGVFVINEDDYMWASDASRSSTTYSGKSAQQIVQQTADNLDAYLDAKLDEHYSKPIFVVSHLPLHYSMRTKNDGDGMYANYIFDVLNEAGENGLNIIFLHGHDHSNGWDDYLGGSCIYLAKGQQINIAQASKTNFNTETLNFTYMNAGYTGYYENHNGADDTLSMTAFKITDNSVEVTRYSADDIHNLKCEGKRNSYKNESGYSPNTDVVTSSQYIPLHVWQEVTPIVDAATGVSVTTTAGTTLNVSTVTDVNQAWLTAANIERYKAYDITVEGFTNGTDKATVSLPVPDGYSAARTKVFYVGDSGLEFLNATVKNGMVTFTTDHFSTYGVGETGAPTIPDSAWVEIPGDAVYSDNLTSLNSLTNGTKIIIHCNQKGTLYVTNQDNGNNMLKQVTGQENAAVWTVAKNSGGSTYYLQDTAGKYLTIGNGTAGVTDTPTKLQLSYISSDKKWQISETVSTTSTTYYLNQYGGTAQERAAGWTDGANSDPGSRWQLHRVTYGAAHYAALTGPTEYTVSVGETPNLTNKVWYKATATSEPEEVTGTYSSIDTSSAGDKTITVTYQGQTLGTITVKVVNRTVTGISVAPNNGEVYVNAAGTAKTGSKLTVTYSDGDTETIDVTLSMLSGSGLDTTTVGEYTGLTVTYGGKSVSGYTLNVLSRAGNDYPEYPNEGSVRVNKVGEGIDFQSTGVAKIELSATGVPMTKGADVVIMLDTSSSMNDAVDGTTRIAILRQSLSNMLASFNQVDATTGKAPDIRIAVADFNGYTTSGPCALDSEDHLTGGSPRSGGGTAKVYTNDTGEFDITAFVPATTYNTAAKRSTFVNGIETASGTNYDAAFYNTYQLVDAVNKANAEVGVSRDLYVVFMSDGAPFQYNGFSAQSSEASWNTWLQGTANNAASDSHSYFYNSDHNKHWWAEAIKGDPDTMYTVIDKDKNTDGTEADVPGKYMTKVNGLGAKMYSIGFCLADDKSITVASMENVLRKIATDESYYHKADTAADLDAAFSQIATNIKKAGKDAVFTDVMGANYDLRLANYNTKADKSGTWESTSITVSTYELYKKSEVNGTTITDDMVGTRKSSTPSVIQETVTFNAEGTEAYSDKLSGNILTNNKINAKLFTYDLATETFKWNLGDITEDEQVLSYYVYLTGSMEGERPAGSYPTNESAVLNYTNWLDHPAHKDTVSPVLPWKDANVSYAFYLVDENGNPVVNRTTGETGSFTNRVAMSTPYVYKTLNLNSSADLRDMQVIANEVLPAGYTLFNEDAQYTVHVSSDGQGSYWTITDDANKTTYVTDYKGNDSMNESYSGNDVDYTHTTVWFAVRYEIKAVPDVVVIDYGLPVDINVLANDMFGENGTLRAVGMASNKPDGKTSDLDSHFATELTATYGTAKVSGDKVRYTPANMQMSAPDKLAYAVKYTNPDAAENNGYYYSDVTVIPATTIYYEDSFVEFSNEWTTVGTYGDGIQAEDRPGLGNLTDANNVYGFDKAYENCTTYSMDSAKMVTVKKGDTSWPTAQFTFKGTGFDIISLTSKATGAIKVKVYAGDSASGSAVKTWIVNTYYGYTCVKDPSNPYLEHVWEYGADKAWHLISKTPVAAKTSSYATEMPANPKADDKFATFEDNYTWQVTDNNALYQIPVIKSSDALSYGTYTVVITPMYEALFDNADAEQYDFYLDAIRIYNPAQGEEIPEEAYLQDKEGFPEFIELRNNMLNVKDLDKQDESSTGIVFIDGVGQADISDYTNYGPNHEVYLAANQSVSFIVNSGAAEKLASIQLGVKALNSTATVSIAAVDGASREISTNSATDLYYDITNIAKDGKVVVITNTGSSLVSLTNIKVTHTAEPAAKSMLTMNAPAAKLAVSHVNSVYLAAAPVEQVPEKTAEEPATTGEVLIPEKNDTTQNTDVVQTGGEAADTAKTPENVAGIPANGEDTQLDKGETTEQNDSAANDSVTADSAETVTEETHRTFGQIIMDILRSIIAWVTGLFRN